MAGRRPHLNKHAQLQQVHTGEVVAHNGCNGLGVDSDQPGDPEAERKRKPVDQLDAIQGQRIDGAVLPWIKFFERPLDSDGLLIKGPLNEEAPSSVGKVHVRRRHVIIGFGRLIGA